MGTSNKYGGPKGANPLIPSWLGGDDAPPSDNPPPADTSTPESPQQVPPRTPAKPSAGMLGPQRAFNNYVRGKGDKYLKRALSGYVRKGTGGSKTAVARMAPSSSTAANLYEFIQGVRKNGVRETLASFSRDDLFGKSAGEILGAITDTICPEGGLIDEAIARNAWDDTILATIDQGIGDIESMTKEQWDAVFSDFIARSITLKVFNDICNDAISLPESVSAVNQVEDDLHTLILDAVRETIGDPFEKGEALNANQIKTIIDGIYDNAFTYIRTLDED